MCCTKLSFENENSAQGEFGADRSVTKSADKRCLHRITDLITLDHFYKSLVDSTQTAEFCF